MRDADVLDVPLDGGLALEVRNAGLSIGGTDGGIQQEDAGGLRRIGERHALPCLGVEARFERRGHREDGIDAIEGLIERRAFGEVADGQLRAERGERAGAGRRGIAGERTDAMATGQQRARDRATLLTSGASHQYTGLGRSCARE